MQALTGEGWDSFVHCFSCHFCGSLTAMAAMAQGLEVRRVEEESHVSAVWDDVVNLRSPDPEQVRLPCPSGSSCTGSAERLSGQLLGPQDIRPDR